MQSRNVDKRRDKRTEGGSVINATMLLPLDYHSNGLLRYQLILLDLSLTSHTRNCVCLAGNGRTVINRVTSQTTQKSRHIRTACYTVNVRYQTNESFDDATTLTATQTSACVCVNVWTMQQCRHIHTNTDQLT